MSRFDIAIVGAGIAGASLAAEVAGAASVILIEAEEHPGFHSTGRSAAFWSETYGGPFVQPLTSASGAFLGDPPAEFSSRGFLSPRGAIHIADAQGAPALERLLTQFGSGEVPLRRLRRNDLEQRVDGLLPGWETAVEEPSCADIDVAALHAAYLRQAKQLGTQLLTGAAVTQASWSGGRWRLKAGEEHLDAAILVNAAGAWADEVAQLAGVRPVDIRPHRRTLAQLRIDPPAPPDLPLIIDALGRFYFKPEAGGRLWLSPHDETPCEPCDCAAEEYDVAVAIDRLTRVVAWRVERVERSWAGLRSFAPDRLPVYGFDAGEPSFFWFAGQGGFGIQTAPAAAKLAAALLLRSQPDAMVAGVDPRPYSPVRFGG